ncbi:MAG TPA: glycosyltransferase family 4 protein [Candidatus Saccharimonadales bacterium]|nr:glycosyltransferase family 4 protein [Candidatus Saccharimonadales bacterium]
MRIALVCPYNMFDKIGGVADVVTHLYNGLNKKGHYVRIITPRPATFQGVAPDHYILLGNTSGTRFSAGLGTHGTWTFDIDSDEIKRVLEEEKFDVINFHEPWAPILARQMLQHSNTVHVGTFHANFVDSAAGKSLVNLFVPYAKGVGEKMDMVTAVSPAPAAVLLEKGGPDHWLVKNIKYVPNGIDIKKYSKAPPRAIKHPQMKTILHVGRLEARKGVKYLLRAYKDLAMRRDDVQLMIAGEGADESKLRDFVAEEEIPRVTFLGYVSEADKVYHLHRADVFCSAAVRGESFGVVLLEAMAAGTPIVAGDNIGYLSVMKDTGAISLVNPKDTVDFSRRLEIMLFNQDIRKVWLNWAKNYVKQFDYPKIVDQYEAVYKEAIKLHGERPKPKSRFRLR